MMPVCFPTSFSIRLCPQRDRGPHSSVGLRPRLPRAPALRGERCGGCPAVVWARSIRWSSRFFFLLRKAKATFSRIPPIRIRPLPPSPFPPSPPPSTASGPLDALVAGPSPPSALSSSSTPAIGRLLTFCPPSFHPPPPQRSLPPRLSLQARNDCADLIRYHCLPPTLPLVLW